MARLRNPVRTNVEAEFLGGTRHKKFMRELKTNEHEAGCIVIYLWKYSQTDWRTHGTADEIHDWTHAWQFECDPLIRALVAAKIIKPDGKTDDGEQLYEIRGNAKQFASIDDYTNRRSLDGQAGGESRASTAKRGPDGKFLPAESSETPAAEPARSSDGTQQPGTSRPDSDSVPDSVPDSENTNTRARGNLGGEVRECTEEWGRTLKHHGLSRDPKSDEVLIAGLIRERGAERVKHALAGFRAETDSKGYSAKANCNIGRLTNRRNTGAFEALETKGQGVLSGAIQPGSLARAGPKQTDLSELGKQIGVSGVDRGLG